MMVQVAGLAAYFLGLGEDYRDVRLNRLIGGCRDIFESGGPPVIWNGLDGSSDLAQVSNASSSQSPIQVLNRLSNFTAGASTE